MTTTTHDPFQTTDPTTGEVVATYDAHTDTEVTASLARAWTAFGPWRQRTMDERAAWLSAVADVLDARSADLAALITREMGKPITQARAEVDKCTLLCRHYAEHGAGYLQRDEVVTEAVRSYVRHDPIGPVLAVMPWNYPFWQAFRFIAPNLLAGNVGLLKHASNVTGCSLAIEEVLTAAGAPEGVFTSLLIGSDRVADVIADDRVRAVTLTGSVPAGRAVAATAGTHLKKSVLELGGSDPFVVLEDADVAAAAQSAADSRLLNAGQSCISAKRFVVHERIAADFTDALVAAFDAARVGDPTDPTTDVGPMARRELRDELHDQVARSVAAGAALRCGGRVPDGDGAFYEPTILVDVDPQMPAGEEELFGPAAAILTVASEDEAIAIANATSFGLGASVWTGDLERGERVAAEIEAGMVFINRLVVSDPRLPFGGVKDSGYGRELGAIGAREFVNSRTVWVQHPDDPGV